MKKEDLREFIEKIPERIKTGGSIQDVRSYRKDHAKAAKVFKKIKPSESEIATAINLMKPWFGN